MDTQRATEIAQVLTQALPYIRRFVGKTIVVKYGGNAMVDDDFEQSFANNQPISEMNATPHYMAPELFHGTAKSMQSDLYAFGIILYEWLMHTRLQANSYQDWAVLHCQQLVLQLPPHFACFLPLLNGLTQKQYEQRFKAVFEAKNTLNNINLH